jgi:hypothetical protein
MASPTEKLKEEKKKEFKEKLKSLGFGRVPGGYKDRPKGKE